MLSFRSPRSRSSLSAPSAIAGLDIPAASAAGITLKPGLPNVAFTGGRLPPQRHVELVAARQRQAAAGPSRQDERPVRARLDVAEGAATLHAWRGMPEKIASCPRNQREPGRGRRGSCGSLRFGRSRSQEEWSLSGAGPLHPGQAVAVEAGSMRTRSERSAHRARGSEPVRPVLRVCSGGQSPTGPPVRSRGEFDCRARRVPDIGRVERDRESWRCQASTRARLQRGSAPLQTSRRRDRSCGPSEAPPSFELRRPGSRDLEERSGAGTAAQPCGRGRTASVAGPGAGCWRSPAAVFGRPVQRHVRGLVAHGTEGKCGAIVLAGPDERRVTLQRAGRARS